MDKFIGIVLKGLVDEQELELCAAMPCVGVNGGIFVPLDEEEDSSIFEDYEYTKVYI